MINEGKQNEKRLKEIEEEKRALQSEELRIEKLERKHKREWHIFARLHREKLESIKMKPEMDKRVAVAMSLHQRLGKQSLLSLLPEQLIENIMKVKKGPAVPPGCEEISEQTLDKLNLHFQKIIEYHLDEDKAKKLKELAQTLVLQNA